MSVLRGFIYLVLLGVALGDVYMHSPRGSNDRLNENTADRANDQRLFDSQNNDKGGYCVNTLVNGVQTASSPMSYVEGSILPIEWTNQHSCGNEQGTCNMVVQYMCVDANTPDANLIRDGISTNSIQNNGAGAPTARTGTSLTYGMNENKTYYDNAKVRERNKGLFTADQTFNANQQTAQNTRQNPAGTTHGYEIAEERDYYPYWHPNPWKDIAVLTDDTSLCSFYQAESGNVKAKSICTVPTANNAAACSTAGGTFTSVPPPAGLSAPACIQTDFTRDNHLGNSVDGSTPNYTWILPRASQEPCINGAGCACVLRLRYNISTGENNLVTGKFLDAKNNKQLTSDPTVKVEGQDLTLAFDTAQTGRTFQDRSFTFNIVPRPDGVPLDAKIYNLNVRGKRGNIVQVYPAVEYDYVPSRLTVNAEDYVNPQWVGCDNNPQANEGEGKDGTDRTNIVQIADLNSNFPINASANANPLFQAPALRSKFALLGQGATTACVKTDDQQNANNCAKLNQAGPYFQGGVIKMNNTGVFSYMGSRNNNFSNRSQKGQLTVNGPAGNSGAIAAIVAGSVAGAGALAGGVIMLL